MSISFKTVLLTLLLAGTASAQVVTGGSGGGGNATNGTGGTAFPAEPITAMFLSQNCPPGNTGSCFQSPINTQMFNDCNYTSGSAIVNCAGSHFVSTAVDGGKRFMGYGGSCQAFSNLGFANTKVFQTAATPITILTVNSSTQITVSANAVNSSFAGNTNCIIYGTPDDTAAAALDTAAVAATNCPKIIFAGGYYLFTVPHFFTQPNACKLLPSLNNNGFSFFGNMFYSAGYELEGRGTGPTTFFVTNGFPETGTCSNGLSGKGCWVVVSEGMWHDFMITGGENVTAPNYTAGKNFIEVDGVGSLEHFNCVNFGVGVTNATGIALYGLAQLNQVNPSGCGGVNIGTSVSANVTATRVSCDNPSLWCIGTGYLADYSAYNPAIISQYNFTCISCQIYTGVNGNSVVGLANTGAKVKLYQTNFITQLDVHSGDFGYQCQSGACLLDADSSTIDMTGGGTNATTNLTAVSCLAACTNYFRNTLIKGTAGGGAAIVDGFAASKTFDQGGNTIGNVTLTGAFIGEANSASQVIVTAAKTVLSAGWGNGPATVTALSGGDFPIQFTVTNTGAGQGASPTITYTFPTALIVAPYSCTATQVGGTNATGTFASSALSATGVTFTFSLTPTAVATEIVQVNCVTP